METIILKNNKNLPELKFTWQENLSKNYLNKTIFKNAANKKDKNSSVNDMIKVYQCDKDLTILKSDLFNYKFVGIIDEVYVCKRNRNEDKCGKVYGSETFGLGGRLSSLISRKEKRYSNIMTIYNFYQEVFKQIPEQAKALLIRKKESPKKNNSKNKKSAADLCFLGAGLAPFTGFFSLVLCFPAIITSILIVVSYIFGQVKNLVDSIKYLNTNLFFEIGKIKKENKRGDYLERIDPNYRYFMYVEFVSTYPRTTVKIPYIVKVHNDFLDFLTKDLSEKLDTYDISLSNTALVNIKEISYNLTEIIDKPDKPDDILNKEIIDVANKIKQSVNN